MAKFKEGQQVLVRADLNNEISYYTEEGNTTDGAVDEMIDLAGKVVTIAEVSTYPNGDTRYFLAEDEYVGSWNWTYEMFEEVKPANIVITREDGMEFMNLSCTADRYIPLLTRLEKVIYSEDGGVVVAFYFNTSTGRLTKSIAKCDPEDTFNLEKGLKVTALKYSIRLSQNELGRM